MSTFVLDKQTSGQGHTEPLPRTCVPSITSNYSNQPNQQVLYFVKWFVNLDVCRFAGSRVFICFSVYPSFSSIFFVHFLSVRLLSVLRGHSGFSSPPQRPMTSASIFPFECSVLNRGTTGTIFYYVIGMTRSLTGDWTRDLTHSKPMRCPKFNLFVCLFSIYPKQYCLY